MLVAILADKDKNTRKKYDDDMVAERDCLG